MNKVVSSWGLLFACNFMWALQFTCVKLVQDQVGPYATVWAPMLLALLLLAPVVIREIRVKRRTWSDIAVFVRLGLLGSLPAQLFITWGTQLSTASNAAVITLALPVVSSLFAYWMLRERMTPMRWISFAIAIVGVVLCSMGDLSKVDFFGDNTWGNVLIFLAIVGNSYYNTGCKKVSNTYSELEMVFFTYLVLVLFLTPLVFVYESDVFARIPVFSSDTWIGLALLAFFHNFLSMVLFFRALKNLDAMQVALSNYLITFMALPVAAFWLNERLQPLVILGGVLVLISTITVTWFDYRISQGNKAVQPLR